MLLLDLNDGLLKQAKVHFQKIVDVEMLCWDGNFDQGYFRFFRIQYHLQIFKMFSYHCVHKVKQKSTSWQSQIYGFFFTLYRILDTAWPIDFVLVKYMIATLTCCHSLYLHECCCNQYYGRRKKMASYSVSIKGCSDSSMIHWFVGKRVNLFYASLIIDLRRFFVKMKDLKFLLYFLAQRISSKTEKDKQINKHWKHTLSATRLRLISDQNRWKIPFQTRKRRWQ